MESPRTGCRLDPVLEDRLARLKEFWKSLGGSCAIGFSGGVDSAFLLASGVRWSNWPVYPFFCDSVFITPDVHLRLPEMIREIGVELIQIRWSPLSVKEIAQNHRLRCYFCKKKIYLTIKEHACQKDGSLVAILDGTQHDDLSRDRPGLRALSELGILTPLAQLGFTKDNIRTALRMWNYTFWDIPSESCLATRFKHEQPLSKKRLKGLYFELMPEKIANP